MKRYTLTPGEGLLILPFDVARILDVVLDPGRRQLADVISGHPELRQWLAELDAIVPPRPVQPAIQPETVWISTKEAADMLGVTTRRVRQIQSTLRHEYHGRLLVFDRADVEEEQAARRAA